MPTCSSGLVGLGLDKVMVRVRVSNGVRVSSFYRADEGVRHLEKCIVVLVKLFINYATAALTAIKQKC